MKSFFPSHRAVYGARRAAGAAVCALVAMACPADPASPASGPARADEADICVPAWLRAAPEGRATSDTFSVARGPDGYVYFGDREGLHRSEGADLRSWFPDPSDKTALPAGRVRALERVEESLFLGTARGLVRFDPRRGVFAAMPLSADGASEPAVLSLLARADGLYVGHREGLTVVDPSTGAVKAQYELGGTGASAGVYSLEPFRGGVVAVGLDRHIFVTPGGDASALTRSDGSPITGGRYAAAQGPDGDLWMSTGLGLIRVPEDPKDDVTSWPDFGPRHGIQGSIRHMDIGPEGRLWFATNYDYARWDIARGARAPVQCRRAQADEPDKPLDPRLLSWALGDTLVLGSTGRQPLIARPTPGAQRVVLDPRYAAGTVESAPWSAILDRQNRLVLNTNQGLYREEAPGKRRFREIAPSTIKRQQVISSIEDDAGRLWLGSLAGLFLVTGDSAQDVPLVRDPQGKRARGAVLSLARHKDTIVAATDNGLVVLDAQSARVRHFYSNDEGFTAINDAPVVTLDDSRTLHVSVMGDEAIVTGAQAVHRIDLAAGRIIGSAMAEKDFAAGRIYATALAPNGTLFIGTANGLVQTDLDLRSFEYRSQIEGLRLGVVSALVISPDGALWHNSNRGIWRVDPQSGSARIYTEDDGLHGAGSNQYGLTTMPDGRLVIANPAGVTVLDPERMPSVALPAAALATYRIGGVETAYSGGDIRVPAESQSIAVTFGAKALRLRGDLRFEYRFGPEGRPGESASIDGPEPINFAALPRGDYQLDVRSALAGGRRSDWSTVFIHVAPKWWQTSLAKLALLGVILGLVAGVVHMRARRSQRRQRLIADERSRIAQDFHDTFLQEVLGALMVGRGVASATTMDAMKASAQQMVALLDRAAQSARASFNALTDTDKSRSLGDTMRLHDPKALYGRAPEIRVIEHGEPWALGWQRTFFISRIAKEAINNACKHGKAQTVDVIITWQRLGVDVAVLDDGVGFDTQRSDKDCGFGLNAMTRLAVAGRARLNIQSEIGAGTRVTIVAKRFAL